MSSRTLASAEFLSNEELLGLRDTPTNADQQANPDDPSLDPLIQPKVRRTMYKITDELMLGSRGLPALSKSLKTFKFKPKKSSKNMSKYEKYKSAEYKNSHHFENLTRLLHTYQLWGHEIFPKYKFKDFIPLLNRVVNLPTVKHYKRELIEKEIQEKLDLAKGNSIDVADSDHDTNKEREERTLNTEQTNVSAQPEPQPQTQRTTNGNGLFMDEDSDEELYTTTTISKPMNKESEQQLHEDDVFLKELSANFGTTKSNHSILDELNNDPGFNSSLLAALEQKSQDMENPSRQGGAKDSDGTNEATSKIGQTDIVTVNDLGKEISEDEFSDDEELDQLISSSRAKAVVNEQEEEEDDDELPDDLMQQAPLDSHEEDEDEELAILREMGM